MPTNKHNRPGYNGLLTRVAHEISQIAGKSGKTLLAGMDNKNELDLYHCKSKEDLASMADTYAKSMGVEFPKDADFRILSILAGLRHIASLDEATYGKIMSGKLM